MNGFARWSCPILLALSLALAPRALVAQAEEATAGGAPPAQGEQAAAPAEDLPSTADEPGSLQELEGVPGPSSPGPESSTTAAALGASWVLIAVLSALLVLLVLALVGTAVWFKVIVPRRKRRPLLDAIALLQGGDLTTEKLERAASLLSQAVGGGLSAADLADARFALAWVRARLGRLDEALAGLAELGEERSQDRETRYLALWLRSQRKKEGRASEILRDYEASPDLAGFEQSDRIAAIAYLERALAHWRQHETEAALGLFDRLRALGQLAEHIPTDLADHQLALGLDELFDKKVTAAEERFRSAVAAAKDQGRPTHHAELALLLCAWIKESLPDIDGDLGRKIDEMEPPGPAAQARDARLYRNLLLWHAVSLLFVWARLPAKGGLSEAEKERMFQRLARLRGVDPDLGDADLLEGLVRYYFAGDDDEERLRGLEALKRAMQHEAKVPDVVQLIAREDKVAKALREAMGSYTSLLERYLRDGSVPEALRDEVRRTLMERHRRFHDLPEVKTQAPADAVEPSVETIRSRGKMLHSRIGKIVKPKLKRTANPKAAEQIDALLGDLDAKAKAVEEVAKELEGTEQRLMLRTGEFLIEEDGDLPVEQLAHPVAESSLPPAVDDETDSSEADTGDLAEREG
ncbi:MAG: hypothetical protein ABIO70_01640 [Pseudomonadota bacterium]